MPTYEYLCASCGKSFDHFQKMSDPPLTRCLCCRRGKVKRQMGIGAGIIFKGSGFYCTDYRSDKYRQAAKKDAAPAGDTAAKPSTPSTPSTPAASPAKAPATAAKGD